MIVSDRFRQQFLHVILRNHIYRCRKQQLANNQITP